MDNIALGSRSSLRTNSTATTIALRHRVMLSGVQRYAIYPVSSRRHEVHHDGRGARRNGAFQQVPCLGQHRLHAGEVPGRPGCSPFGAVRAHQSLDGGRYGVICLWKGRCKCDSRFTNRISAKSSRGFTRASRRSCGGSQLVNGGRHRAGDLARTDGWRRRGFATASYTAFGSLTRHDVCARCPT